MSTITEAIADMSTTEAREYVIAQLAALPIPEPFTFADLQVTITLKTVDSRGLVIYATATRGGVPVTLPADAMPLIDPDPPYKIPDGTFTEQQTISPSGRTRTIQVWNEIEDLAAALKYRIGRTMYGLTKVN